MQHPVVRDLIASMYTLANAWPVEPRQTGLGGINQGPEVTATTGECFLITEYKQHVSEHVEGQEKRQVVDDAAESRCCEGAGRERGH